MANGVRILVGWIPGLVIGIGRSLVKLLVENWRNSNHWWKSAEPTMIGYLVIYILIGGY